MPCTCVNNEGLPTQQCWGCKSTVDRISANNGFTGQQLNQIRDIVRSCLSVSITMDLTWQDGYIKGFKSGYEYGQD